MPHTGRPTAPEKVFDLPRHEVRLLAQVVNKLLGLLMHDIGGGHRILRYAVRGGTHRLGSTYLAGKAELSPDRFRDFWRDELGGPAQVPSGRQSAGTLDRREAGPGRSAVSMMIAPESWRVARLAPVGRLRFGISNHPGAEPSRNSLFTAIKPEDWRALHLTPMS
jgi:hypothetical protein